MQDSATSGERKPTNRLATANQGNKDNYLSTDAVGAQAKKTAAEQAPTKPVVMPSIFGSTQAAPPTQGQAPAGGNVTNGSSPTPSGYSGAPLAAGG
jgi:hypothetical protein